MYSDKKKRHPMFFITILAVIVIVALVYSFTANSGKNLEEESAVAIRDAVWRSAMQCYVVEGVYPPNLDYLKEKYGLQVNTQDFYITYDAFSSNLPPTIRVTGK